jgi:hypothetical protein
MRLVLAVIWLLPAILLIRRNSAWTPVAMVALTVSLGGLVRRRRAEPSATPVVDAPIISPPLENPPRRLLFHLACAGALINSALIATGMQLSVAAGMLGAMAAAIVLYRSSPEQREGLAGRNRRASVVLALLLTVVGLLRWGAGRWLAEEDGYYAGSAEASGTAHAPDLSFRGVILFVEKPTEQIVAPSPMTLKSGFADPKREPLVILFSGVYWFTRVPGRLPPSTSLIQHGSPNELFYRAADGFPLFMEAHQSLGRHISLECCSGIDVDIVNVDRYPGSVHVEVLVTDTAGAGPKLSLGLLPVQSTEFKLRGEQQPRKETLRFQISSSRFGSFDEITVRFHLFGVRYAQSARMAIERFTLRPR